MLDTMSDPGTLARARALFFDEGTLPKGLIPDPIWQSWQRCVVRGLRAEEAIEFNPVHRTTASATAERNRHLIVAAEPAVIRLADAMTGSGYGILVTDREGACVAVHGPIDSCSRHLRQALRPGVDLSESAVATNAMATAMMEERPIGIFGAEHFYSRNHAFQCVAAPIFDPCGVVAGSIDITRDTAAPHFGALSLILDCAAAIETAFFLQAPAHLTIALSWTGDAVLASPPALLSFGPDGEVRAMNRIARRLLGVTMIFSGLRYSDLFVGNYAALVDQAHTCRTPLPLTLQSSLRIFARPVGGRNRGAVPAMRRPPTVVVAEKTMPEFGDPAFHADLQKARKAFAGGLPILLQGETGTGKEVTARFLHGHSAARSGNFIAINCGAIPKDLIEGELFGHADGAYTGARRGGAAGKIEQAHGGTLFLDEIGDMPLDLQTRLLRVLESREVIRLGASATRKIDFQLLSATHQDLDAMVRDGLFRADLYYRLKGIQLHIPPLRRRADVAALIDAMLAEEGIDRTRISKCAIVLLRAHPWPGNTRELRHALRYAKAMACDDAVITAEHFPDTVQGVSYVEREHEPKLDRFKHTLPVQSLKALEDESVRRALAATGGNITAAARQLGISRATLHRRIQRKA
jgi:transcriptional regulator of acetoin/glycerol metabolism